MVGTVTVMENDRLQAALEPTVVELFARHLENAKEWFPHEMVPWSRARDFAEGEAWNPAEAGLSEAACSALFLNLLTEDNLPYYYRAMDKEFGESSVWSQWARRWTAEEGRHSIVIRDYLTVTRSIDLRELERARMHQVSSGVVPGPPSTADGIVYVALQELATRISHRNTGKLIDDPDGVAIMRRVAIDENHHHLFYRDLTSAAIEIDPSTIVEAIERQVREFSMPGTGVPDFELHAKRLARAQVYDLNIHYEQVLLPIVVRHWRVEHLTGLRDSAKLAQEKLMKYLDRLAKVARRVAEQQAVPVVAGV